MKIFKLENGLEEVSKYLKKELEIKTSKKLPRLNKSRSKKGISWSIEVRNLVNQFYKNDFDQLKYEIKTPEIKIK